MFRIYSFKYEKNLLAKGSVLVLCTKFNVQIGAGRHVSDYGNTGCGVFKQGVQN